MKKLQRLWDRFLGLFPHSLPVGATELERFSTKIIKTYNIPDFPSYRQLIATLIMHTDQANPYVAPRYFGKCLRKAMANEVAYTAIQEIKAAEKKAAAEKTNTKSEVIPLKKDKTSDEPSGTQTPTG